MPRGMKTNRIDVYLGQRLRHARQSIGMTAEELGPIIGVTHQQIYKYERGYNRMSVSRLYQLARALNTPMIFFYGGFDDRD